MDFNYLWLDHISALLACTDLHALPGASKIRDLCVIIYQLVKKRGTP